MNFKRIWLILLGTVLSLNNSDACWFEPGPESYRFHLLQSDRIGRASWQRFHFTSAFLNEEGYELDNPGVDKNVLEWRLLLGDRVSSEQVYKGVYESDYLGLQVDLATKTGREKPFIANLLEPRNAEAKQTLLYIKFIEASREMQSYWDFKNDLEAKKSKLIDKGIKLYQQTSSNNLKCRIAYQLLKVCTHQAFDSLWTRYLEPVQYASQIGNWALMDKAGYHYRQDERALSNYYFAKAFQKADEKKRWAYLSFTPDSAEVSLIHAHDKQDSSAILFLAALRKTGPALPTIRAFNKLNAEPEYMEMLLIREVNKLEDRLLTYRLTQRPPAVWTYSEEEPYFTKQSETEAQRYTEAVLAMLLEDKPTAKSEGIWHLSASYLSWMLGKPALGKKELAKAKAFGIERKSQNWQLRLLEAQLSLQEGLHNKDFALKQVMNVCLELEKQMESTKWRIVESNLFLALGQQFHQLGDKVTAACCYSRVSHYIQRFPMYLNGGLEEMDSTYQGGLVNYFFYLEEEGDIPAIETTHSRMKNPNGTKLDSFLFAIIRQDPYRLSDLLATRYFRAENYTASSRVFHSIPESYWSNSNWNIYTLNEDPFTATLFQSAQSDNYDYEKNKKSYPRVALADSMKTWTAQLNSNQYQKGELYWKMAQVNYNTTYEGRYWMMGRYWWSMNEDLSDEWSRGMSVEEKLDYYGARKAAKYYQLAYVHLKSPRKKAYALGMKGKCEMDMAWAKACLHDPEKLEGLDRYKSPSQALLKRLYPEYYHDLFDNCDGLDYYFSKPS